MTKLLSLAKNENIPNTVLNCKNKKTFYYSKRAETKEESIMNYFIAMLMLDSHANESMSVVFSIVVIIGVIIMLASIANREQKSNTSDANNKSEVVKEDAICKTESNKETVAFVVEVEHDGDNNGNKLGIQSPAEINHPYITHYDRDKVKKTTTRSDDFISTDTIKIGDIITLEYEGQEKQYQISTESDTSAIPIKITKDTPIGKAVLGKKKGDIVSVLLPEGNVKEYIIKDIGETKIKDIGETKINDKKRPDEEGTKVTPPDEKKPNEKPEEKPNEYKKRTIFFVFQGKTYEAERWGGYIWAPRSNISGRMIHHWKRLLDVRKGDIILHCSQGYIRAISTAKGSCYNCDQPKELASERLWLDEGRKVDCDYIEFKHPIKTASFTVDIIKLSKDSYSPFNWKGGGNMGYLYYINRDLAKIFIKAAVQQNRYLANVNYITELLSE